MRRTIIHQYLANGQDECTPDDLYEQECGDGDPDCGAVGGVRWGRGGGDEGEVRDAEVDEGEGGEERVAVGCYDAEAGDDAAVDAELETEA